MTRTVMSVVSKRQYTLLISVLVLFICLYVNTGYVISDTR